MPFAPEPLLICRIAAGRVAIPARAVAGVLPLLPLWRPPSLPLPLIGFATVAGEALAVLSPDVLFGGDAPAAIDLGAHLVRVRGVARADVCLLVVRAEAIVTPATDALKPVAPADSHNGCIAAEVTIGEGVAHLMAIDRLLVEGERRRLDDLAAQGVRREAMWSAPA